MMDTEPFHSQAAKSAAIAERPLRIAIIGGGPAGSAAAIKLAAESGIAVTLIEKSDYSDYRAGETLPPQVAGLLAELGVWDEFIAAEPTGTGEIHSAWAADALQSASLLTQPHSRGWHIQRHWFDRLLAQAAVGAGATLLTETRVKAIELAAEGDVDNSWSLQLSATSQQATLLRADMVIDASGRKRIMARDYGHRALQSEGSDLQLALIAHCQRDEVSAFYAEYADRSLLIETVPAGWMYAAPVTAGECVVALMTTKAALQEVDRTLTAWQQAVADSRFIQQRLQGYQAPAKVQVYPAWSQLAARCYGTGWVAIGDAAMTFDPLTGMGISKALLDAKQVSEHILAAHRSGALTADTVGAGSGALDFSAYAAAQRAAFVEYTEVRRAYYRMEKRWPDTTYWREVQQL